MPVLVLDNGAYNIKAGYSSLGIDGLVKGYNAISRASNRKTYIGNAVHTIRDVSGLQLRRPHERGQLVNWESQKAIWDTLFYGQDTDLKRPKAKKGNSMLDPSDTTLICTETPLSLPALSTHMDQIVFEEYEFEAYYRCTSASLVPWNNMSEDLYDEPYSGSSPVSDCALVIDSGYSATHVIPVITGEVYWPAVKRLTVGGKLLTNYLRETCSFRHYNMMSDTYIMNIVKERTCFVSSQFASDLKACHGSKKHLLMRYMLPNFENSYGRVLAPDETADPKDAVLNLQNERFTIPELLFDARPVGLDQAGVPETVMRCVKEVPEEVRSLLLANVVLTGGNANLRGFRERLEHELRSLTPQEWALRVGQPEDPESYAFQGGCQLGERTDMLKKAYVTRKEYLEHGPNLCLSKFGTKVQESSE